MNAPPAKTRLAHTSAMAAAVREMHGDLIHASSGLVSQSKSILAELRAQKALSAELRLAGELIPPMKN